MKMTYLNLETQKEVSFEAADDKKIICIYGKNGVGKTTLSTSDYWNKDYVFNDHFIRENIYISDESGYSTSTTNKSNFSELFVGKDIINKKKEMEILNKSKKEYNEEFNKNISELKNYFETKISENDIIIKLKL